MSDLHALMDIAPGVRTLVDTCAGVKAGERVLIVTDTGMDQGIVAAFALLCRERGDSTSAQAHFEQASAQFETSGLEHEREAVQQHLNRMMQGRHCVTIDR